MVYVSSMKKYKYTNINIMELRTFECSYGVHPNGSFVTNFNTKEQLNIYTMSVRYYNAIHTENKLFINGDAYDIKNRPVTHCSSLVSKNIYYDLSDFWRIFDNVKKISEIIK